jgi:digalactosyldiacylglycerol synthase
MKRTKLAAFSLLTISCCPAWYPMLANAILRKTPRLCDRIRYEYENQIDRQKVIDISIICNIKGGGNSNESQDDNDDNFSNNSVNATEQDIGDALGSKSGKRKDPVRYKSTIQEKTLRAKQSFLDKISLVSSALLKSEHDAVVDNKTEHSNPLLDDMEDGDENDNEITLQSDLLRPGRKMAIVTTASIPWFTGTSVNPLLRAAYLSRLTKKINNEHTNGTDSSKQMVTLVIPWLEMEEDRQSLYGDKYNFTTPEEQEAYIRNWLRDDAGMPEEADPEHGIKILFYPSRYHSGLKSIFAMGDIISVIPDEDADVCILEEPEHLNWYRAPGDGWTKKFRFVIGIIHTNYVEYASSHYSGLWTAPAIRLMSSAMVRAYCHVVIKLSDTLQTFAEEKERTSNVHGVRIDFLKEGDRRAKANNDRMETDEDEKDENPSIVCKDGKMPSEQENNTSRGISDVYFIGKLLWAKGLDKLIELENYYKGCTGRYFSIDIYGNGPQEKEIKKAFRGRSSLATSQRNYRREAADNDLQDDELSLNVDTIEESRFWSNNTFSTSMAKISKHIQATKKTIRSSTEFMDLELPKTLHELRREPIPALFPGRVDHASLTNYKVFVNPSKSEVLCTTTAEVS